MDESGLYEQNPWWRGIKELDEDYDISKWNEKKLRWIPGIVERITLDPFSLHIVSGPRQSGKTTAMKLLIKKLAVIRDPKSIFYFNCENLADYRELTGILEGYIGFREDNSIENSVIILDEITLPKEWYRSVKFLIDKGKFKNDVVILTGSSSIAVKKETELFPGRRGNGQDYAMLPLSFRGFLKIINPELHGKITAAKSIEELEKKASEAMLYERELGRNLKDYMQYGGFPLSVSNMPGQRNEAKKAALMWIKNAVLKAERSDLIARQIISVLIECLQSDVSWEGISKKIEVKSPKTVSAYIELLKSLFAVNVLYNVDAGSVADGAKIRFGRNKKIHFTDPLLLEAFEEWCLVKAKNKEPAIAEALAVEHLSRMFPEKLFFWRNGFEIDAIALDRKGLHGFEVKWSDKTTAKSLPSLKSFMTISKKIYSKKPLTIPLGVFLSILEV